MVDLEGSSEVTAGSLGRALHEWRRGSFPIGERVYEAAGLRSGLVSGVLGNSILRLERRLRPGV